MNQYTFSHPAAAAPSPDSLPPQPLTGAVVGGGTGGRLSLDALQSSPHFELKAVADVRSEVNEELSRIYPGIQTFTDYETMFRECPTDVVCVSTYAPTHVTIAEAAMKLPLKAIVVEKPLSESTAQALRLLEAIKRRQLPMAVPHGLITIPAAQEIIRIVQAGELGELRLIEMQSPCWDIINAGIHWFHFALLLTGLEPVETVLCGCDASSKTYRDGMQVETTAVAYVTLRSGVRIILQTGDSISNNGRQKTLAPHFRFVGTKGLIEYQGWSDNFWICNAGNPAGGEKKFDEDSRSRHRRHFEWLLPAIAGQQAPDYGLGPLVDGSLHENR